MDHDSDLQDDGDSMDEDYYSGDADDYYNSDAADLDVGGFDFLEDIDDDSDVYSARRHQVVWILPLPSPIVVESRCGMLMSVMWLCFGFSSVDCFFVEILCLGCVDAIRN